MGGRRISANDVREGNIIKIGGDICVVHGVNRVKPGKGKASVQLNMKKFITGTSVNERLVSSDTVEKPMLEEISYVYLYSKNDIMTVMDMSNCEQLDFSSSLCKGAEYLCDNMELTVLYCDSVPLIIKVPSIVTCEVVETEAVIKGQTATSSFKPALLSNGVRMTVPQFIKVGDKVLVKTEDGSYSGRA